MCGPKCLLVLNWKCQPFFCFGIALIILSFFVILSRLLFTLPKKHRRIMIMIQGFGYLIRSGIQNANRSHPAQKNISNETIYQKTNDVIGHLCFLLALLNGEGTLSKCTSVLHFGENRLTCEFCEGAFFGLV